MRGASTRKRIIYPLLALLVLLFGFLGSGGSARATEFFAPVDSDYSMATNSAYLSQADFPNGAPAAVVVDSGVATDPLVATVLAKAANGPLLLASSGGLTTSVQEELTRLKPAKVFVVSRSTAVVADVRSALPALKTAQIEVLNGADAYQTARLVAEKVKAITGTVPARVFIVPSDVLGASVAAAAVAAANGWPILLTPQTAASLPAATAQAITNLGVKTGVLVDTRVSSGVSGFTVEKTIIGSTSSTADPGARYTEALAVAKYAVQRGWANYSHVALGHEQGGSVAYSVNFPFNVLLATRAARQRGAYLLTRSTGLHPDVAALLKERGQEIQSIEFMRPDYNQVLSGAWSFAAIRQVKALNSPRVTGLSKTSGSVVGGGPLTVTGSGFSGVTRVRIGKTDLPAGSWQATSSTSITINALPAAAQPGAVEIFVYNYWNANPSSAKDVYFYLSGGSSEMVAMQVVHEAVKYLGVPYVWAGSTTSGFDCSGFTQYVYGKFKGLTGVSLPHKSTYQANFGTPVGRNDLMPGDLVFFGSPIGHVGIYVGNGLMINAPRSGDLVTIENVFRTNYTTARRLISPYTRVQQSSSLLAYTGAWTLNATSASASGGSYGYANSSGSSVTVTFNGMYMRWIATTSASYGIARVVLDGKDVGTVNMASATTAWQRNVWNTGMLPSGVHTVTIHWTGTGAGGNTRIGLDAFDVVGTPMQARAPNVPTRFQDTDRRVMYTGLWTNLATGSASAGCLRYINKAGSASMTFKGTSVAWVAKKGPDYGMARVKLDGVDKGTVDLYGSATTYLQKVWSAGGLTDATHTLTIEWTGQKNQSASAANINVDAFDVLGTVSTPAGLTRYQQSDSRLAYIGSWGSVSTTSASGGSYARAKTSAEVIVRFTGTYLSWSATAGTTMGKAHVSLDGVAVADVNLARAASVYDQSVWASGTLTNGPHVVRIARDGASPYGKYISVDAFDVIGTLTGSGGSTPSTSSTGRYEQTNTNIKKTGVWGDFPKADASGSSYGRSSTAGASATVYFTGTRIDYYAMKGTTTGVVDIYLDNVKKATVDLAASVPVYKVRIWSSGTLTNGNHALRVVRSTQSTTEKYLTLDFVDIWGAIKSGP